MMEAYNCLFGYPLYSDVGRLHTPALSGGSWVNTATVKLTNLQTRHLSQVARSTDDATASTQFDVDLGTARQVRVLALLGHNISRAGLVRIRGSNTVGDYSSPVYDTGWLDAHDVAYPVDVLPWGHPSLWDGRHSAEDLLYVDVPFVHISAEFEFARYWRVEIDDTANADSYVEIGRLVIAGAGQASINMEYGASVGLDDQTARVETDGTATIYRERPNRRRWVFTIGNHDEDESLVLVHDMQRRLGKSGQLFFAWDPTDSVHMHRRSGLAVFSDLSTIEQASFGHNKSAFALIEEL